LTVIFWLTTFALLADEGKWWVVEQDSLEAIKDEFSGFSSGNNGEVNKLLSACKASRAAIHGHVRFCWLVPPLASLSQRKRTYAFSFFLSGPRVPFVEVFMLTVIDTSLLLEQTS
jgi:hypothetical protein